MPAATEADKAAARELLGLPPTADPDGWEVVGPALRAAPPDVENPPVGWTTQVTASDGQRVYDLECRPDTVNGGTYLFCSCPNWPFAKGKGQECKHVRIARANWSRRRE